MSKKPFWNLYQKNNRTLINHLGWTYKPTFIYGKVQTIRKHKNVVFADVADRTGVIQVVFDGKLIQKALTLTPQSCVRVRGIRTDRNEKQINWKYGLGDLEFKASKLKIDSLAETLPFDMGGLPWVNWPTDCTLENCQDYRLLVKHWKNTSGRKEVLI